jgi:hypothetical protein
MGVWQRGTTFNTSGTSEVYCADRFILSCDAGSATVTQQTFTPGTAPVAGYESQYFLQFATTVSGSNSLYIVQKIEDVRSFAGQTVTLSYWAKTSSGTVSSSPIYVQGFGSGGSGAVAAGIGSAATITTSWQRFTHSVAIPSIAGKTIGAGSSLQIQVLRFAATATVQLWGVQLEYGSKATPFETATGTIQGELAACSRYFQAFNSAAQSSCTLPMGFQASTTTSNHTFQLPINMRTTPSASFSAISDWSVNNFTSQPTLTASTVSSGRSSNEVVTVLNTWSGAVGATASIVEFVARVTTARYYFSAEL